MCRTISLHGVIVLEKRIVKELFPEHEFEGRDDPERHIWQIGCSNQSLRLIEPRRRRTVFLRDGAD
jgi:hypothetical protein